MQQAPKYSEASIREAREALTEWKIPFDEQPDGTLLVETLGLSGKGLTSLPDLRCVVVQNICCFSDNKLKSLQGAPEVVRGMFNCDSNQITTLKGGPQIVGGSYWCSHNKLTDLVGAPEEVGYDMLCVRNNLESLHGAPRKVGGKFVCDYNNGYMPYLEGAPQEFIQLKSDLGIFYAVAEIPLNVLYTPETIEKMRIENVKQSGIANSIIQKDTDLTASIPKLKFPKR